MVLEIPPLVLPSAEPPLKAFHGGVTQRYMKRSSM